MTLGKRWAEIAGRGSADCTCHALARAVTTSGFALARQFTGSTRPTMKTHATTPIRDIADVTANGQKKLAVCWTTNPVRAGQIMPAKFAKPFCGPYHLPTASRPARRWQKE